MNVSLAFQFVGLQYNDDQNVQFIPPATLADAGYDTTYPAGLPPFNVADLQVSHDFGPRLQLFFGMQNLDEQGVLRPDQPVDDRQPAAGELRRQDPVHREVSESMNVAGRVFRPDWPSGLKTRRHVLSHWRAAVACGSFFVCRAIVAVSTVRPSRDSACTDIVSLSISTSMNV